MLISKYFIFLAAAIFLFFSHAPTFTTGKKPYVVYLGAHSHGSQPSPVHYERATNSHHDLLGSFVGSKEKAKSAIFYSYTKHINGFAANLEEEEANELSKHPDVISVLSGEIGELQTTRSWEFLGLETNDGNIPQQSLWRKARFGEDAIIANFDTGAWPESESFHDDGMGPIPSRWKGSCDTAGGFRCNRKLIGARIFKKGYEAQYGPISAENSTARDFNGHGSHTLSTAGGRFVRSASVFGYGEGTAKGGSPNSRVAAYKTCWPPRGCHPADILAAFDQAIDDGVDILSLSLGGLPGSDFDQSLSIGSFHAVNKGILVVCSGGNRGPTPGSAINLVPWIMSVGASTMDREFPSYVHLGNGQKLRGQSVSTAVLPTGKSYPLIFSGEAKTSNATSAADAIFCRPGSLDPAKVKGKIVACSHPPQVINSTTEKGEVVKQAGGVGMIVVLGERTEIQARTHVLPAIEVDSDSNVTIQKYYHSTSSPTAYITRPTTQLGVKPAPRMAAFSSQGPNPITPELLKPDVTAPGVNVIAAFVKNIGPSYRPSDSRRVPFNVISGTSMSCPHAAGIAGLLKTMYPKWSPAAIRSAMMTTAQTEDNTRMQMRNSSLLRATPFSYGAGHVQPDHAADPGLVYDLTNQDYLNFLCNAGYNHTQIAKFTNQTNKCDPSFNLLDFNYPSITVPNLRGQVTISRTVKNVVYHPCTYTAQVFAPSGIHASVQPMSLKFEKFNEEKTFKLRLQAKEGGTSGEYAFGKLIWSDGIHYVTSPIVVRAVKA